MNVKFNVVYAHDQNIILILHLLLTLSINIANLIGPIRDR